jgi:hypothetical protein
MSPHEEPHHGSQTELSAFRYHPCQTHPSQRLISQVYFHWPGSQPYATYAPDQRVKLFFPEGGGSLDPLFEIAKEVGRLTNAAREGRVEQADLKGGTISISNIGALGGTYAAPIINAPEAAIVAIGKTQWLPRFDEHGAVQRRAILTVTWAGDHRFIDGGTIASFCNAWKGFLEAPESMLLHMA